MVRTGKVARFDYGEEGNLAMYGTQQAPNFDVNSLSQRLIDSNLMLISGSKDYLVPE